MAIEEMRASDGALLIVALVIAWSFYKAHRDPNNNFNILDLLMENGRLSRIACAFMATLILSSWVIFRLTSDGKLTDVIFGAYLTAWVAPIIAKLFSTQQPAAPAPMPPAATPPLAV